MELALAVALDLMEGRLNRGQAENRLAEDQVARGRRPRTDTALVRELQLGRYAELRAIYKAARGSEAGVPELCGPAEQESGGNGEHLLDVDVSEALQVSLHIDHQG